MAFSNDPNMPPHYPWEARLSEAAARIEAELRSAVKSIDEEVVPEVRKHGSQALRALASKIDRLAQTMEDVRHQNPPKSEEPSATGKQQ